MRSAPVALVVALLASTVSAAPDFTAIDAACEASIAAHDIPGAVVLVGKGDAIAYEKAYGNRSVQPTTQPMAADTIFDLASLTKNVSTATCAMILVDRGLLDVHALVAKYLPEFGNNGKETITVEQLMTHTSGLMPDDPMSDYDEGPARAFELIMKSTPAMPPGVKFVYSDVNFLVMGRFVERISGKSLDQFARDEIFVPLKMTHTTYKPPVDWRPMIAPTTLFEGRWLTGEVHDPRAFKLGGVAGHAGVFSTADDLSRWVRMLNRGGELDGVRLMKPETVKDMLTPRPLPGGKGSRGLGVDVDSPYATSVRGGFPVGTSFGHTGYTGTSYWSDPATGVYVILLTNRVHPIDAGAKAIAALRQKVATIVVERLLPSTQPTAK